MPQNKRIFSCRLTNTGPEAAFGDSELIFPYWSFTKTAIALCALKLVEQGMITLDEPMLSYPFSLRQLLNHTAGLPDYSTLKAYRKAVAKNEEPWPRDVLFDAAMAQGILFLPGKGWSYSNLGYMLVREFIEHATGKPFFVIFNEMIGDALGLESVELATTREQFARVYWAGGRRYHPGWVYHGCLIGTAADAARLLHGLFTANLLNAATREQMLVRFPLGGALTGRPWTECGYALGLMSGRFGIAGRAIGHSGGGPFCVNAVYHFPDRANPVTVATFTDGWYEGVAEFAAVARSKD